MTDFLPGVPAEPVLAALTRSPGSEWSTGKFDSPESSAALAVNAFGWFLEKPQLLPPLPGVPMGKVEEVEVEAEMRFPWSGGKHPWLDAALTTATTLVGIEAKRFEPFRPAKRPVFSEAYESRDWGPGMARFDAMRKALTDGRQTYRSLDAVPLVKQAYGLRNQGLKRARGAVLVYLHAAPTHWASGKPLPAEAAARHEAEITEFARAIAGSDVVFVPIRWHDLLTQWSRAPGLGGHAKAVRERFGPL